MTTYKVIYYMPHFDSVFTMTVRGETLEAAKEELHKRLRQKAGVGLWKYEMYPYNVCHSGELNTKVV